ncbi:ATP-binding protein [Streptomyces sp. NPDC051173]|uniref:ATP-binding protein n=1 Tax=Streptomyces sp. NPDC051173 TaxID=3155164 RepID=UPI00344D1386
MSNSSLCLPGEIQPQRLAPTPTNLNYSLGLPGGAYCLSTARTFVRRLLDDHGLGDLTELAVLSASELLGNVCLFTSGGEVNLSVRWRFGVLRLTVFDDHPAHEGDVIGACRERRLQALSMLQAFVDACDGICGLAEAGGLLAGNKMWVVFTREAAKRYARL